MSAGVTVRTGADSPVRSVLIEPFDIDLHKTEAGVATLQSRFASWLRSLTGPTRFLSWQMPANLYEKISLVTSAYKTTSDEQRRQMQMSYRRFYKDLDDAGHFQRSIAGMLVWTEQSSRTVANVLGGVFDTQVYEGSFPRLFQGKYRMVQQPYWHLAPSGAADGRPYFVILNSYEFVPSSWNFFNPFFQLLELNYPMALCVDIPQTYERNVAVTKIENIIGAYKLHLRNMGSEEDSQAVRRIQDCYRTLQEINAGHSLHSVSISIAVAADDLETLQERAQEITTKSRPWFMLRQEVGELMMRSVRYFSPTRTKVIGLPDTSHPVTSPELALMFSPVGFRKLGVQDGTLRGISVEGGFPVFHNSFRDKRAVHEVWVGMSGFGKTYALLCYLNRVYAEDGIPFDYLEPMGHGVHIAKVFGVQPYILSAKTSVLNPQDVMFPTIPEQISHTISIYEAILKRPLTGDQLSNLQRSLLANALEKIYAPWKPKWNELNAPNTPTCSEVIAVLRTLGGDSQRLRQIAEEFADELGGLCTGSGPYASFLDGHTKFDFGSASSKKPRVFCFHQLEGDPVLVAIAYTFTLASIRRDSLANDVPRIIAVDEVYRLMSEPSLLDFLIEAAKTFRTRRKKLICIDQQMMFFLQGKARYIFENCPIRVIFSQAQGLGVFLEDAAFSHFNEAHINIIRNLQRFQFLFDIQDEGTYFLQSVSSNQEYQLFGST